MKIAFFLPSFENIGGVESATLALLNSMANNSTNSITLLTLHGERPHKLNKAINYYTLQIQNYKKEFPFLIYRFLKFLRNNEINILITVETISLLFSFIPFLLSRSSTKLVVWEHFNFFNDNGRKIRKFLRKISARFADAVVTLTARDSMTWKEKFPNANIDYVYNIFSPSNDIIPLKSKKTTKIVVSIGRYVQVKGFDRLIESWSKFEKKYRNTEWVLKIVGYGEQESLLQKKIDELKTTTIKLEDGRNGVDKFLNEAEFYCMTSYFEGLPMVLIEAQSYSLPIIAFDIYTGPSEIVDDSSGMLIEDNNLDEFADAIYEMIRNEKSRKSMAVNALEQSVRFSPKNIVNKWNEIFKNL